MWSYANCGCVQNLHNCKNIQFVYKSVAEEAAVHCEGRWIEQWHHFLQRWKVPSIFQPNIPSWSAPAPVAGGVNFPSEADILQICNYLLADFSRLFVLQSYLDWLNFTSKSGDWCCLWLRQFPMTLLQYWPASSQIPGISDVINYRALLVKIQFGFLWWLDFSSAWQNISPCIW